MTYFLAWTVLTWKCPMLLSFAPAALKPVVCQPEMKPQVYISEDSQALRAKIEDIGPGVPLVLKGVMWDERGRMIEKELPTTWKAYID